jgi:PAS domain S-box-containing protein
MCKLLIVEDNPEHVWITKKILLKVLKDSEIIVAAGFDDAVDKIGIENPNLFLVDINLGAGHTGLDLIRVIQENVKDRNIAVMTASTNNELLIKLIDMGIDKFFLKPYNRDELVSYYSIKKEQINATRALNKFAEMLQYQVVSEKIPMGVTIVDIEGNIVYVNEQMERQTGYTKEELLGAHTRIFKSGLHEDTFYTNLWETVLNGRTWKNEICNKRKDGSLYWEELTAVPYSEEGKVTHIIAYKSDITKQREMGIELKSIIEANKSLIFILDNDLKYLKCYPEQSENFFAAPSEFLGQHVGATILDDETRDTFIANFTFVSQNRRKRIFQYKVENEIWECVVSPFNGTKIIAIMQDVTEREEYYSRAKSIEAITNSSKELRSVLNNFLEMSTKHVETTRGNY